MDSREAQGQQLTCIDCGDTFVFTIGEQRFYASKGLSLPKRCPICRERRKLTINPDPSLGRPW